MGTVVLKVEKKSSFRYAKAILTIINAFFAAAEMAIVSINKNRLRLLIEEGNKKVILAPAILAALPPPLQGDGFLS